MGKLKHFGIFITDLESERFLSASNDQIATWLFLHAFCSKQMNGGTIEGASGLPERFWSRHGITASILPLPSPLWSWIDSDLSVEPYDIDGENLYLKKVKGGTKGAEKRWKGSKNRSPNGSPNRPDQTRPNQTRPNQTRPNQTRPNQTSSSDEGGGLFSELDSIPSKNCHELFDYWQSFEELPKIRDVTAKRKCNLKTRMKEEFFRDNWKTAIDKIKSSPFLTGTNDRGWKADIDWLLTPGNLVKVIEGKYDNQTSKPVSKVNLGGRDYRRNEYPQEPLDQP